MQTRIVIYPICCDGWVLYLLVAYTQILTCHIAIVVYEYIITFYDEIKTVWKRRWTATSFLLLSIRWIMVANVLIIIFVPSVPDVSACFSSLRLNLSWTDEEHRMQLCVPYKKIFNLLWANIDSTQMCPYQWITQSSLYHWACSNRMCAFFSPSRWLFPLTLTLEVFAALRVFAIGNKSYLLACGVFTLDLVPIVINVVSMNRSSINHSWHPPPSMGLFVVRLNMKDGLSVHAWQPQHFPKLQTICTLAFTTVGVTIFW